MRTFSNRIFEIAIITIYRFGDVEGVLNPRDNIIIMVDEAHRTQEGDLEKCKRSQMHSLDLLVHLLTVLIKIFRTFGATEDKSGYLSRYTFQTHQG